MVCMMTPQLLIEPHNNKKKTETRFYHHLVEEERGNMAKEKEKMRIKLVSEKAFQNVFHIF